ncbi:MAG: phage portal protein [Streptomyces sp.]|nr:phage portal protein [Streptomyces sp.]
MGLVTWLRDTFRSTPLAEAAPAAKPALAPPTAAQVRRVGYEYGIPLNSASTSSQIAATSERQQVLSQLHQAYMSCNWVSACVDLIARTVTAGGLQIVADTVDADGDVPPEPDPVTRIRRLVRFVNPREDMVQLLRCVATDLMLFGDAYIEVVELLGEPVALYTLDATTMTVISDQHGEVSGYVQDVDGVRTARFDPDQVIHISLDAPRGGLYGVSPAQKVLLPVTAWLFTMATLKECFRRGDPPRVHVDLQNMQDADVQRWREQYRVFNLGPKAVGEPLITTNDGKVVVLDQRKVTDYLDADRQLRDQIIGAFGVPPAKLGIIETGNLGSGSGESQDKTFRVNTVIPIANLILEKLNYHLVQLGFGIEGWHLEFGEIDYRDSKIVEEIRDTRLRNGSYTLNRYRDEIGEPPVEGGDDPVLVDRQNLVLWSQMARMSEALIAQHAAPGVTAGMQVQGVTLHPQSASGSTDPRQPSADQPDAGPQPDPQDQPEPEETWDAAYQRFLCEALAKV